MCLAISKYKFVVLSEWELGKHIDKVACLNLVTPYKGSLNIIASIRHL